MQRRQQREELVCASPRAVIKVCYHYILHIYLFIARNTFQQASYVTHNLQIKSPQSDKQKVKTWFLL